MKLFTIKPRQSKQNAKRGPHKLSIESLESREIKTVSMGIEAGDLFIREDASGGRTYITEEQLPSGADYVRVRAWDSDGNLANDRGFLPRWFDDIVYVGSGNSDTLISWVGRDMTVYGLGGADTLLTDNGNDRIFGGAGNDYINAYGGNDIVDGGSGNDTIRGGTGDDILRGQSGNDQIIGGAGDDSLYGGADNDDLRGDSGDDGLFGGTGRDRLEGGQDDDRFLVFSENDFWTGPKAKNADIVDRTSNDALIHFQNAPAQRVDFSAGRWARFDSGTFTSEEVENVDKALKDLHTKTANTRLLKKADGGEIVFERLGSQIDGNFGVGGINKGGSRITLVDNSFSDQDWLEQVVFHEIGHNWDDENARWSEWQNISGWTYFFWVMPWDDVADMSPGEGGMDEGNPYMGRWWYNNDAKFAREYGRFDPMEDFATYFAKVMMDDTGGNYDDGGDGRTSKAKGKFMKEFFDSLS